MKQQARTSNYQNAFMIKTFIDPLALCSQYMDARMTNKALDMMRNIIVRFPPPLCDELMGIRERIDAYFKRLQSVRAFNWNQRAYRQSNHALTGGRRLAEQAYELIWAIVYDKSFFEYLKATPFFDLSQGRPSGEDEDREYFPSMMDSGKFEPGT